jgi:hypothetical protein
VATATETSREKMIEHPISSKFQNRIIQKPSPAPENISASCGLIVAPVYWHFEDFPLEKRK